MVKKGIIERTLTVAVMPLLRENKNTK